MATTKGGYDYEFVETPGQCLECSICLLTLREPHVSSCCGNHFCKPCISRVQENKNPCPLCNENGFTTLLHKGVQRAVNSLIIYCTWKRLGCDWKGELGHLSEHLEPKDGKTNGCGLVMVECSHKCGVMVERRSLTQHQNEACSRRPLEVQMACLAAKIEQRLAIVEQRLESELQEKQDIQTKLSALEEHNKSLVEENKALQSELEAVKSITMHTFDTPPFYYTVYNFNHYKTTEQVIFSPPFYSHPGGYKFRLQLYPNGLKYAKDKFVSLFVAILRGEFDESLQWPFNGTISIEIFNVAENIWDLPTDFTLAPIDLKNRCVKRPLDCLGNDGRGTITWLSHDKLKSDYMLPGHDFVRFRVTEVQLNK